MPCSPVFVPAPATNVIKLFSFVASLSETVTVVEAKVTVSLPAAVVIVILLLPTKVTVSVSASATTVLCPETATLAKAF